jgi:deoxyribonuclease-4
MLAYTEPSTSPSKMRVRQVLSACCGSERTALKKLLPPKLVSTPPDAPTHPYPSALLSILPAGQTYAYLGIIAEELLCLPPAAICLDTLAPAIRMWCPGTSEAAIAKVAASKTTEPFLEHCRKTAEKLRAVASGDLVRQAVVSHSSVEGHPDARTATQIFEMKLTGQLSTNWPDFLLQTFAYAALDSAVTDIYIVLPLQETVWAYDVRGWANRTAYCDLLCATADAILTRTLFGATLGAALIAKHAIGHHAGKQKSLPGTILSLRDYSKPYQIFLGGPQTTKMTIADAELAAAAKVVADTRARIYVHSQYIINLCHAAEASDDWNTNLLIKNLQYANAAGFRGVVVHVGKSTTRPLAEALDTMRSSITKALAAATPECPLLLETPAGQGTETLTQAADFVEFVQSFADERLRVCLDTCHVFAAGTEPLFYLKKLQKTPGLLKLVHYNDSEEACGSCKDRHAPVGCGKIGLEKMTAVAEFCSAAGIPMVIE